MYCCYDPTTQLNKLSPIKAWIPEKKHEFATHPACLVGPCLAGSTHQILRQQCCRTFNFNPLSQDESPHAQANYHKLTFQNSSAWPPPTCPASPRQRPSCSPRRACEDVAVPVGTLCLPRLGGAALPPRGSRWSTEVVKHGGHRSRGGPQFLD